MSQVIYSYDLHPGMQFRGWTRRYGFKSYEVLKVEDGGFSYQELQPVYGYVDSAQVRAASFAKFNTWEQRVVRGMLYVWLHSPVLKTVDPKLYCH